MVYVGKPDEESSEAPAGKNSTTATTPAASTWNITVDTDGLKQQDDTATV